jgi:translation initiation factor IF-3
MNGAITAQTLRVISEDGKLVGIISRAEALDLARSSNMDLVEVSPNASPPIAKLTEFGKFKYELEKKNRQTRKNNRSTEVKQIRISLNIGDHDLETKLSKAKKFLEDGDKVRMSLMFKGRENSHKDLGFLLIEQITDKISEWASLDQEPRLNGRNISVIYKQKVGTKKDNPQKEKEIEKEQDAKA